LQEFQVRIPFLDTQSIVIFVRKYWRNNVL
jgi:hypothetical protein